MQREMARIEAEGPTCSIWQHGVVTRLPASDLGGGCLSMGTLNESKPSASSSERVEEISPAASAQQLEKCSSTCPTCKLSGYFPNSLNALLGSGGQQIQKLGEKQQEQTQGKRV